MMVLSMPVGRGSVIAASSHPPTPYPDPLMDDIYINSFSSMRTARCQYKECGILLN